MRARNIKPGFYTNEDLSECSVWARFIFPGLWMLADREGRLEDRPKRIKGELLRFDSVEIIPLIDELEARGFLVRYQNSDGRFIQITKFAQNQTPHYSEKDSAIKPPTLQEYSEKPPEKPPDQPPPTPSQHSDDSEKDASLRGGRNPLTPDSGLLTPDSRLLTPEGVRSKQPARGSRLPIDVSPETLDPFYGFARKTGVQDPGQEFSKFKDFYIAQPGSKGVKIDWAATWRNWCRNSIEYAAKRNGFNGHQQPPPPVEIVVTAAAGTDEFFLQLGRKLGYPWNRVESWSAYVSTVKELEKNVRH